MDARRLRRPALALASLAVGFVLLLGENTWRNPETSAAGVAIRLTGTKVAAVPSDHLLFVSGPHPIVLVMTSECSSVYLLAALALTCVPLLLIPRLRIARVLLAAVSAGLILVITNLSRMAILAATIRSWGVARGLEISHVYLGTTMTLIGTFLAGLAFAAVLVLHRPRPAPAPTETADLVRR